MSPNHICHICEYIWPCGKPYLAIWKTIFVNIVAIASKERVKKAFLVCTSIQLLREGFQKKREQVWSFAKPPSDPPPRGEREFRFPNIPGNTGLPFPFPKFGNTILHSRSHSQKLGMKFSVPFPKVGNAIYHSRSQSLGMG